MYNINLKSSNKENTMFVEALKYAFLPTAANKNV